MDWADPLPYAQLLETSNILGREFYARPTVEVARGLLGKILVHGRTAGRIVETEAYLGQNEAGETDFAAHSARGRTERTKVIFGPPGHAYVYLIYGMYECLNLVAEQDGVPGCVLLRAIEPLTGLGTMRKRRPGAKSPRELGSGPGKLTLALGVTRRHYGRDVTRGSLTVRALKGEPDPAIEVTPRVGIRRAADWPLRFVIAGNPHVSA